MNYKLIDGSLNDIYNPKKTILLNRGIENYKEYLNLTDDCLYDFRLLANIEEAVRCLLTHIENRDHIHIVVDCDTDGYCSAAILYQYIKLLDPNSKITYSIHTGKLHGLSEDVVIPETAKLVILPDAGTNDVQQCQKLSEQGVNIIVLDHHIQENENPYAIIINNQACNYPNKALCGTGIVYKFLQALDEETWSDYADKFLDLVALANIGDAMDIKSYETKRLIDKGLSKIRNKFFKALIEKQSYSIGNDITINNIQFYIVPLVNGLIRVGSQEEKDMMFRAFVETDEVFRYKPRRKSKNDPEPEETDESIYDRVARLASNAKNRQGKYSEDGMAKVYEYVQENGLENDKVLFINCSEAFDNNLTGILCMKAASYFNKPCLMLRKKEDESGIIYEGSARNINAPHIPSLRDFLESTGLFEYCTGHHNAFGCGIKKENIKKAITLINEKLKDVDFSPYYEIDFIIGAEDLDIRFIKELDDLKAIWGQGIPEAKVLVTNIVVDKNNVQLMGKNKDTWSFILNDEIKCVKFKCPENDFIIQWINGWDDSENIIINAIGKCGINNFNGIMTPQVVIEDYEINHY